VCHGKGLLAAAGLFAALAGGCAPKTGWQRLDRVCQASDPPRVCFDAEPDAPLTLEVGGETLVPGECAEAPRTKRASLKAVVVDGRNGQRHAQHVGAGKGRTATVTARMEDDGLDVGATRSGC